jgi:hypothetical protein
MSWRSWKVRKCVARSKAWKDLMAYSEDECTLYFQYRRCSPYVECRAFVHGPWRLLWHKAVWESAFDSVPIEEKFRMAKNILKRLAERKAKAKTGTAVADPAGAKKYPNLHCLMTALVDEEQNERRVATLTVFADDGCYKVCLNERNVSLTLWASSETLDGLWEALEARLSVDDVDWREGRPERPQEAKKKSGK